MNDYLASLSKQSSLSIAEKSFLQKVFLWMTAGLAVTALSAFGVISSPAFLSFIVSNQIFFFGIILLELGLVIYLSARINQMSASTAVLTFLLYAALNGVTFALVFLAYAAATIFGTFLITAGLFGIMALYGYITKKDLTSIGSIAFMALIGIILASVVNIFFFSETVYWIISYAGVLVFCALTAYDTQKLKRYAASAQDNETAKKFAIFGALALYLDFINLFLFLLRIFGGRD